MIVVVLGMVTAARTNRTKVAAKERGIQLRGVHAFKTFQIGVKPDVLVNQVRSVVQSNGRFARVESATNGVDIYVRGNIWTWGEIIELRFDEQAHGTDVYATCRPRLKTTLIDYGQNAKDLALFIDLLTNETNSGQPRQEP